MHLIQQFRRHLDFVNHDDPAFIGMALPQQRRPGRILGKNIGLEQIDEQAIPMMLANPVALSRPSRPWPATA
jgi:hypothetical protein